MQENKLAFDKATYSSEKNNQQIDYITTLSVISSLAVVILHTNGAFWKFNATAGYWFTANIIECVFYFAVPIFFMISGITLIDYNKRYSMKEYFKKRISKSGIPFLFWSLAYLLFQILLHPNFSNKLSLISIFNGILTTQYANIFWFFIPLFCCYLIIPVFGAIADKKRIFKYMLVLLIVCNSLIPFIIKVFHIQIRWNITFPIGGYSAYILLGYYMDKIRFNKKRQLIIYGCALIGLLMHIIGTYYLSMAAGKIVDTYKDYLNIPCILYSSGVYVFLKENVHLLPSVARKGIDYLRPYTFALYLLQFFFLVLLPRFLHINTLSIGWRLGGLFLILPLVILMTKVVRLLPFGKIILP